MARWFRILVAMVGVCCALQSHGAVVSGSFSGIAYNSFMGGTDEEPLHFDGAAVTGRFRFDTAAVPLDHPTDDDTATYRWRPLPSGSLDLTFQVLGRALVFGGVDGWDEAVSAERTPSGLVTTLTPVPEGVYFSAQLHLVGPLLDGLDLASFRAGPVDLEHSYASFFESRDFGGAVALTSVQFDARAVPEPGAALLWLAALAALAGAQARRRRGRATQASAAALPAARRVRPFPRR